MLDCCRSLEQQGFQVSYLLVGSDGLLSPDDVRQTITDRTILVSVMLANNEIGVVQPIREIGKLCRERRVLFHTDATQGVGKMPFDVSDCQMDLVFLSAHKMYGPQGVGALFVSRREPHLHIAPLLDGGGQEQGLRNGTLNVASIVRYSKACELTGSEMLTEAERLLAMRERLRKGINWQLYRVQVNGSLDNRLPGNLNLSFEGWMGSQCSRSFGTSLSRPTRRAAPHVRNRATCSRLWE
jgi:cysteine desulfurase